MLEQQVQELREVPRRLERVEWQILQLRQDLTAESSATRTDLRTEMHGMRDELRTEMRGMRDELREDIRIGVEESQNLTKLMVAQLATEIQTEVVSRLDRLLELQPPRDGSG
jgi:hypothetical protein